MTKSSDQKLATEIKPYPFDSLRPLSLKLMIGIVIAFGFLWACVGCALISIAVYDLAFRGGLTINGQLVSTATGWGFVALIAGMTVIPLIVWGASLSFLFRQVRMGKETRTRK